jgi:hypothetical protein
MADCDGARSARLGRSLVPSAEAGILKGGAGALRESCKADDLITDHEIAILCSILDGRAASLNADKSANEFVELIDATFVATAVKNIAIKPGCRGYVDQAKVS